MDEIKRKLALIEAQLSGRSLQTRLIATAPLFFLAVGMMTGILVQYALSVRLTDVPSSAFLRGWSVSLGLCSLCVLFHFVRARQVPHASLMAWGALLCFCSLGAIRLVSFETASPDDIQHLVGDERVLATVRGRLVTDPHSRQQNWCFAQFVFTDPSSAFYLKLDQIETDNGWREVSGTIRVQVNEPTPNLQISDVDKPTPNLQIGDVNEPPPNLQIGDEVQAYCWLYQFQGPRNPGQFDLAAHLKRRNVHVGASVPSREAIQVQRGTERTLLSRLRNRLSEAAARALLPDPSPDNSGEGLLEALLLGERGSINPQTYEAFRRTGLLHFISLSGLHLGIFVGIVWRLCKTAGLMKPGRAIVCIIATATFLMIVPPRPPTVRAAIIVWTFCASIFFRRRANLLNALSLAAIVLLLIRPTQLFEVGWQLSFSAVAAIIALTDRVEEVIRLVLTDRIKEFLRDQTRKRIRNQTRIVQYAAKIAGNVGPRILRHFLADVAAKIRKIPARARRLFSMGVAAWIGGVGILLYHFHAITPLTSLWTVLVFPLVFVLLALGFLKIALFFVLPTLSYLIGVLVTTGADWLIWIVKLFALPDINYILIGHVALWVVALYYGLVLFALFFPVRRPLLKKGLCLAVSIALIAYVGVLKWQRTHRDHLSLTCLDVGHGQAILLQPPGTGNLLFDAGSMYRSDVGTRIVLPFLDYMGISHLDAIVVSHNDIDHINGIPEIVDRRRVDHIYANDAFFARSETSKTAQELIKHLDENGHTIERIPRILQARDAVIETLWPSDDIPLRDDIGDNNTSLVSRITFDGVSILLCSDIEEFAQQRIMASYPGMTAQIVVVPHHGSTATRHEPFLPSLRPEILIASCGRKRGDQPAQATSECHAREFSTAANGALAVCVHTNGRIIVVPYLKSPAGD